MKRDLERLPDAPFDCLRCEIPMKEAGRLQLRDGTRYPVQTWFAELTHKEEFEVNICPQCGKVEFFI